MKNPCIVVKTVQHDYSRMHLHSKGEAVVVSTIIQGFLKLSSKVSSSKCKSWSCYRVKVLLTVVRRTCWLSCRILQRGAEGQFSGRQTDTQNSKGKYPGLWERLASLERDRVGGMKYSRSIFFVDNVRLEIIQKVWSPLTRVNNIPPTTPFLSRKPCRSSESSRRSHPRLSSLLQHTHTHTRGIVCFLLSSLHYLFFSKYDSKASKNK